MQNDIEKIKTLVDEISKEQLKHTDCFITDHVQLFMPMTTTELRINIGKCIKLF